MDLRTLKAFAEELICPICLEEFEDPRVFPCHHCYCAKCIETLITRAEPLGIHCPECRKILEIPRSGGFPPAFMVNRLKERLDRSREQSLAVPYCTDHSCPVKFTCLDCRVAVCSECVILTHKGHSCDHLVTLSHSSTVLNISGAHRGISPGDERPPLPRRITAPLLYPSSPESTASQPLHNAGSPIDFSPTLVLGTPPQDVTAPPVPPRKANRSLAEMDNWYCEIDRYSAAHLLEGRMNGTFLCRPAIKSQDSVSPKEELHTYTIDLIADGKICHIKVLKLNGMYSLQPIGFKSRVEFKSIVDLVIYHSEHAFAVYDLFATLKYAVNGD